MSIAAQPSSAPTKAPNDFLELLKDDDEDFMTDEYARYISQP
jgi:hypothetical protein